MEGLEEVEYAILLSPMLSLVWKDQGDIVTAFIRRPSRAWDWLKHGSTWQGGEITETEGKDGRMIEKMEKERNKKARGRNIQGDKEKDGEK